MCNIVVAKWRYAPHSAAAILGIYPEKKLEKDNGDSQMHMIAMDGGFWALYQVWEVLIEDQWVEEVFLNSLSFFYEG